MLRSVALVRTDVSEEFIASIIRVTRIRALIFLRSVRRLLVTANVPTSPILVALMIEATRTYETSFLHRATRRNFTDDGRRHITSPLQSPADY
jgi:hypothetical protein